MPPKPSPPLKKQPLTLAQLAAYDDILTDALVDHAYYWTTIPKNRPSYHPSRGVREEETTRIIQDHIILEEDLDTAEEALLASDGFRKFYTSLKSPKERDDFRRHLRRYMQIYLPDCPFEVNSSNRYTIVTHEASITARRNIRKNETVKYLSGIQVMITPEEEKEISVRKKDFSIVVSSRNKCASLFMGPARFANHDCGANAKLMTTGQAGIEIIAIKDIDVGEEITVTYGENYFGEDNCECLCKTCEDNLTNGWSPGDGVIAVQLQASIERDLLRGYSLRRRRRDESTGDLSRTPSVTPGIRPRIWKTKRDESGAARALGTVSPTSERQGRPLKRQFDALATPPVTPLKKTKILEQGSESVVLSYEDPRSSLNVDDVADSASPDKDSAELIIHSPKPTRAELPSILKQEDNEDPQSGLLAHMTPFTPPSEKRLTPTPTLETNGAVISTSSTVSQGVESLEASASIIMQCGTEIPEVAVSIEISTADKQPETAKPKRAKYQRRRFFKQTTPPARNRVPGDYTLTPLLLSEPNTAWVHCTICRTAFVQHNAYYTRSSCPRCERHSKLYGYMWPKTVREGPRDTEERVLDHRMIHRFLDAEDEAKVRGRKVQYVPVGKRQASSEAMGVPQKARGRPGRKKKAVPKEQDTGLRRSGRARRASSRLVAL